jgi:acetate kinase
MLLFRMGAITSIHPKSCNTNFLTVPNGANEGVITAAASPVAIRVIRTDNEQTIARLVCRELGVYMPLT